VSDDTIIIRAPAGTKARWVRAAHPGKLSDWIISKVDANMPTDEEYETAFSEAIGADLYQRLLDEKWLPFPGEKHKRLPFAEAVQREVKNARDFLDSL
jgi:hypothetical protein